MQATIHNQRHHRIPRRSRRIYDARQTAALVQERAERAILAGRLAVDPAAL